MLRAAASGGFEGGGGFVKEYNISGSLKKSPGKKVKSMGEGL